VLAERIGVGQTEMSLPFFLTAILQKISKREEFGEALAEMRLRAHPLRQKLTELELAIKRCDIVEIGALRRAVNGESLTLIQLLQPAAIAGAVAAVLTEGSGHLSRTLIGAILVLTYASQYSASAVSSLTVCPKSS
jgi:hypothetical protein